jgi:bifunctional enzyme CysN/CysC
MGHQDTLLAHDIEAYLNAHQHKTMLRFITCGSVDDGKSTLIGRLLFDSNKIFHDQLQALEADSAKLGTQGEKIDFALLVDGLDAEREQGITIDVAYRYFTTERRKFIVADTPGHEQYTRNMVTGASTADLAIILVDARKGVLTQTRRHTFLASLMGIKHMVLAINKMDLIEWSQEKYEAIAREHALFAARFELSSYHAIPISGLNGDNITSRSAAAPWYEGAALLPYLEDLPIEDAAREHKALRMPVQWVNRPHADFRGFAGLITSGVARAGDGVRIMPSGRMARIARIVTADGDLEIATSGQAVTLTLHEDVDCSRGDVITAATDPTLAASQFETTLIWMAEEKLLPGRSYWLKLAAKTVSAQITDIKYKINVNSFEHLAAKVLELNDIAVCAITLSQPIAFEAFSESRDLGGFILIDRVTNATVAAGLINFALRRSQNVQWQDLDVTRESRAFIKGQKAAVIWFTGLSGSGKSTIANLVEKRLHALGRHTVLLDGDNVRHGLNRDLGFTAADRVENIRRVAEVAKIMADAGLIVLVSFISPFAAERRMARDLIAAGEFFEVFIDTTLQEAERRDPKGLYKKARAGQLANFTGIDSPYEPPLDPEIRIDTAATSPTDAAEIIVSALVGEQRMFGDGI